MKRKFKYDPEDLESLLLNKKFDELYSEEKAFVLRHMESAEEYASMRKTLLSIVDQPDSGPTIRPRSSTKRKLMREFDREKSAGWQIWLNSFFMSFSKRPAVSFGALAVIVVVTGAFFFYQLEDKKVMLAENKEKTEVSEPEKAEEKSEESESEQSPKTESAEEEAQNEMPPVKETEPEAPEVAQQKEIEINEDAEYDTALDLDMEDAIEEPAKDRSQKADSEVSDGNKVADAKSETAETTEELAESVQPQVEKEELGERRISANEINTDSFIMDDQMGNVSESTTIQGHEGRIKTNVQTKSTSMAKAAFLLKNLHTSM